MCLMRAAARLRWRTATHRSRRRRPSASSLNTVYTRGGPRCLRASYYAAHLERSSECAGSHCGNGVSRWAGGGRGRGRTVRMGLMKGTPRQSASYGVGELKKA
jgi:hypothetical protein